MMRRGLLAPLAVLVAAGCATADVGCTLIGCESGVFFSLSDLGPDATGTVAIHACLDAVCIDTEGANPAAAQVATSETGPRTAVASIRITNGDTVIVQESLSVELQATAPNGESCGPVCYSAAVQVTKDGLVPLPL